MVYYKNQHSYRWRKGIKKDRSRKFKVRFWKRFLLFILLVGVISGCYICVTTSSYFVIKRPRIQIVGKNIRERWVEDTFKTYVAKKYGGILPNIFKFDIEGLEKTFLKEGIISAVQVKRLIPYTIFISVIERKPVLKVANSEFFVDSQGIVFKTESSVKLPTIEGLNGVKGVKENKAVIVNVLKILSLMKALNFPVTSEIERIDLSSSENIIMITNEETLIYFGKGWASSEQLTKKICALQNVISYSHKEGIVNEYIELRYEPIVIKPLSLEESARVQQSVHGH